MPLAMLSLAVELGRSHDLVRPACALPLPPLEQELNAKVVFLQAQGLSQEDVGTIMLACPSFFQV